MCNFMMLVQCMNILHGDNNCNFTVGFSGPYPVLIKKRPLGTLAGLNVLLSLFVHLLLIIATQLALWYYVKTQNWLVITYKCNHP